MPSSWQILEGEALAVLRSMPESSVDCCVTSPPYWRMRDYGHPDQLGMEPTVDEYVERLAEVFDEVRRVLKPTGTCWINVGDCYAREGGGRTKPTMGVRRRYIGTPGRMTPGVKKGDLIGVPWLVAFALRARGWYLRGEQIWAKANPLPDGSKSRPGRAHEHVFLLTKSASPRYYYDHEAIRTPLAPKTLTIKGNVPRAVDPAAGGDCSGNVRAAKFSPDRRHRVDANGQPVGAGLRSVWSIAGNGNRSRLQHFALMPRLLAEVCIRAGSPEGATVLDPFAGAGTTGLVALRLGRSFLGIELVPSFAELARQHIEQDAPLLNRPAEAAE